VITPVSVTQLDEARSGRSHSSASEIVVEILER
jgi:hypothetical protein